jgi:hypothetical protein
MSFHRFLFNLTEKLMGEFTLLLFETSGGKLKFYLFFYFFCCSPAAGLLLRFSRVLFLFFCLAAPKN